MSAGIQPNVITYNSAISACEKGGQRLRALDLWEWCVSAVIKPDVITYNAAICACEEGGEWQCVSDWLRVCVRRHPTECDHV